MIEKICGFKDSQGKFHDTEYEALKADFIEYHADNIWNAHSRMPDYYSIKRTIEYFIDIFNVMDRPTVPFWKNII